MSGRKSFSSNYRKSRGTSKQDDRKENPTDADLAAVKKLIRRRISKSPASDSSNSDKRAARYKTPSKKRKNDGNILEAPRKEKRSHDDVTDDSDVEGHKRSQELLVETENVQKLKKVIQKLNKQLKSNLKAQTVKISLDLDRKNKDLEVENNALRKEVKKLKSNDGSNTTKENDDLRRVGKEKDDLKRALDHEIKNSNRLRKERNLAEEKASKLKKEVDKMIGEIRRIRSEMFKVEKEDDKKKQYIEDADRREQDLKKKVLDLKNAIDDIKNLTGEEETKGEVEEIGEEPCKISEVENSADGKPCVTQLPVTENDTQEFFESSQVTSPPRTRSGKNVPDVKKKLNDEVTGKKNTLDEISNESETIDIDFASDEEFEEVDITKIGNYKIKNVKNANESYSKHIKIPAKIVEATKYFTITSLNNKILFIVQNSKSKASHDDKKFGVKKACGLSPHCGLKWSNGDAIANVFIFGNILHPRNETEQWVCAHHAKASIEGVDLQIQTPLKNPKPKEANTDTEVAQEKKTKPETDDEDPFESLNKLKSKLSLRKKKK